jgi:hypothetical protein
LAYLYRHIRLDKNCPFYVGIGTTDDSYLRAYSAKNRNIHWNRIISKTDYEVEVILDGLTKEQAIEKEYEFISIYKRVVDGGTLCNISQGGMGGCMSDEVNKSRSKTLLGRRLSDETKEKIRKKAIGRIISDDVKAKMSISQKLYGERPWLSGKGHLNGRAIKIYQYSKSGEFIREWECMKYAADELGVSSSSICGALSGYKKTCAGYIWTREKINGKTVYTPMT